MPSAVVIKGRLTGPRSVELDEPVSAAQEVVQVIVTPQQPSHGQDAMQFLANLPPGTRSREDIDQQVREEREAWGNKA